MTDGAIILKRAYVLVHEDSDVPFLIELLPRKLPGEKCIVLFSNEEIFGQFCRDRLLSSHAGQPLESPEEIRNFIRDARFESGEPVEMVAVCLDPIDIPYANPEDYMRLTREDFMKFLAK